MKKRVQVLTAVFLFCFLLASVPEARGQAAGEMVRVEYNNGWWLATVLQVKPSFGVNTYNIKYTQSGLMEWVAPNRIVSASVTANPSVVGFPTNAVSVQAGQAVQVEYNGQWYPATLLEMKDAYGVKTHHIKYAQSGLQEWVAPNRIKSQ